MSTRLARLSLSTCLLSCFATSALATDYYVDAVNGSNAAAGTSPATAWKTITFAAANAAAGSAHTIHVGPGTYADEGPLRFNGQHVVGDAGSAVTIIQGPDFPSPLPALILAYFHANPSASPLASITGFTLRNGTGGIDCSFLAGSVTLPMDDIVIANMPTGVGVSIFSGNAGFPGEFHVQMRRVRTSRCAIGIQLGGASGNNTIDVSDCVFTDDFHLRTGVSIYAETNMTARFDHCRFSVLGNGVSVTATTGTLTTDFSDCLLADNARAFTANLASAGSVDTSLTRCTVAFNSVHGLGTFGTGAALPKFALDGVLVFGNTVDYLAPLPPTSVFSQIGGPNPLFRDSANGDFRVNFGSPVIDAGNPATAVGTLDLNGVARSVDGDLDTLERADIGCFEFRPLEIKTTGQQGTLLTLEVFGGLGGSSAMRLSRGPLATPVMTQFGEFDLALGSNFAWMTFPTAPGPGTQFLRLIPTHPSFIGQTYSFQGLVTSSASPLGAAWSNAVSFTIVP